MSFSNIVTDEDIKNGGYTLVSELNPPEFVNGNKYYFYHDSKFRVGTCSNVQGQKKDSCIIKFNDGKYNLTPKIQNDKAYWRPSIIARGFYGKSLKDKVYKDTDSDYYGGKRRKRKGKKSTKKRKRKGKKSTTRRKRRY
jgi:hypothetical protein